VPRKTTELRPIPEVGGKFLHTIEASDRLDHLAYKYYRQSLHWWRICDANPDAPSPRHLLGQVPQAAIEFAVRWTAASPPWNLLFGTLADLVGVEAIVKGGFPEEGQELESVIAVDEATTLFTLDESLRTALDEGVNTQQYPPVLEVALVTEGLLLDGELRFTKVGTERWQIEVRNSGARYLFSYSADLDVVTVYDTVQTHAWSVGLVYNTINLTQSDLSTTIEALGFEVIETTALTRIGRQIVIPPRYTGI
jgi:hypothetical protein